MYFQEESKAIADQDPDKIRNLEQMKKDYEEKIKSIKDAMSSGTEEPVTPEEIRKLQRELFCMRNFGTDFRSI